MSGGEGRHPGRLAYAACLFTLAYVPIHVVWAMGGTLLLPGGARTAALPGLGPVTWIVSALLVLGAVIVLGLARPWGRRLHPAVLLVPVYVAAIVCLSHALFGFVTKALYVAGFHGVVDFPAVAARSAAERLHAARLDLALFEPWFMIEGLLLAAAGHEAIPTGRARRRWTAAVVIGALGLLLFGAVLARNHLHFAIG